MAKDWDGNEVTTATEVEDLPFSTRVINVFKAEGIRTVGDIMAMDGSMMLRKPHFGRKSFQEVVQLMADLSFKWPASDAITSSAAASFWRHPNYEHEFADYGRSG